jgi:hypothetical protein
MNNSKENVNELLEIKHDPVSGHEALVKQVYETTGPDWGWDTLISVTNIKKIKGEEYWNNFLAQMCKDNPKKSIKKPKDRWIPESTKKRLSAVETQENFDTNLLKIDDIENEIKKLREKISYHNDIYYNHPDKMELSDYEFDMMLKDLEQLELKYPQFSNGNSPTQKVGN